MVPLVLPDESLNSFFPSPLSFNVINRYKIITDGTEPLRAGIA
jgi:hypothetical protein